MKLWKRVLLTVIFIFLSLYCLLYGYALFHHLSLDEQRKNITLYDINGEVLYESNFKKNMSWTPLEDIPQFLQDAVVSVEDKRFYTHAGIDPIHQGTCPKHSTWPYRRRRLHHYAAIC